SAQYATSSSLWIARSSSAWRSSMGSRRSRGVSVGSCWIMVESSLGPAVPAGRELSFETFAASRACPVTERVRITRLRTVVLQHIPCRLRVTLEHPHRRHRFLDRDLSPDAVQRLAADLRSDADAL